MRRADGGVVLGFHSPRMVRLLRMSNSANLSKEGLPHAWPLDKR
jgi:hypothetical protein